MLVSFFDSFLIIPNFFLDKTISAWENRYRKKLH